MGVPRWREGDEIKFHKRTCCCKERRVTHTFTCSRSSIQQKTCATTVPAMHSQICESTQKRIYQGLHTVAVRLAHHVDPTLSPSNSPTTSDPTLSPSVSPITSDPTLSLSVSPTTSDPTLSPSSSAVHVRSEFPIAGRGYPCLTPKSSTGRIPCDCPTWCNIVFTWVTSFVSLSL